MEEMHYPLNSPFKPSGALKISLMVNFLLLLLLIAVFTVFPILLGTGADLLFISAAAICILILVAIFFAWVRLYYESMWYELRDDELSWKRGVWFHTTGIVPYNRITNIDIRQGPVMRALGISTLAIQTAGYSGQTAAEIRIEGMEYAGELREILRTRVRHAGSGGDGTGGAPLPEGNASTNEKILGELVKIRIALEQQKK